jgi:ATP-binding cassette subfamily B protein
VFGSRFDAARVRRRLRAYESGPPGEADPLFGPGIRLAHERRYGRSGRLITSLGAAFALAWRADPGALAVVASTRLVRGGATAVSYLAMRNVFRNLLAHGPGISALLWETWPSLTVICGALVLSGACDLVVIRATGRLGPRIAKRANLVLLESSVAVELVTIENADFHNQLAAARRGADAARHVTERSVTLVNGLLSIAATGSVLFVMQPLLAPLLLLGLVPRGWAAVHITVTRHASSKRWMEITRQLDHLMTLGTSHESAEEVRVHGVGAFLLTHYDRLSTDAANEQARLARHEARTQLIAGLAGGSAATLTYGVLVLMTVTGQTSLAVAATAALAIQSSSASLTALVNQAQQLLDGALYIGDWKQMRDRTASVVGGRGTEPVDATGPARIAAKGLRFRYPGSTRNVIEDVDVEVRQGEVVALVGENGSGKSTLVKLLCGLYLPSGGSITWDGVEMDRLDRNRMFDQVTMVSQDFMRWPFTVRTNIMIGRSEHPVDEMRLTEAATKADAHEMIAGLDAGWDTLVAPEFFGGKDLSGGQWQRLALARAWYRDAPVLIFDEPTSALDPRSEIEIFDRVISAAAEGTAVILISHRLASVARADRIYVMSKGRVVERGTHSALMSAEGTYADLYRLQANRFSR